MDAYRAIVGGAHAAAAVLAWALAILVFRARASGDTNRLLASLLFAEGAFQVCMAPVTLLGPDPNEAPAPGTLWQFFFPLALIAIFVASALYLRFLATLNSPLTRAFRGRAFRRALVTAVLIHAAGALAVGWLGYRNGDAGVLGIAVFIPTLLLMLFASVYGFAACISAWKRAAPGTPARRRALAFVLAFGGRDAAFALHILAGPVLGNILTPSWGEPPLAYSIITQAFLGLATVLFAVFLAYGILSTQLFDLDLKIKTGISRSTVAAIGIAVVLIAAKIVEFYLNSAVGLVAGGICAGLVLFLAPRLNKLGDKVADTAMPRVQPTSEYLAYKKLEVYRGAVETALEGDGVIDPKERAMLDRLRTSLDLAEQDAAAIEAEADRVRTWGRTGVALESSG